MFLVVPKLDELSHFDLNLLTRSRRSALRPLDCFFDRLHLDKPVARDQLLRFREWPVNHCLLSVGRNVDARARRTRIQARSIKKYAGRRLLLVVLHHRIDRFLARHLAGFGVLRRFQDQHEFHLHLSRLSLIRRLSSIGLTLTSNQQSENRHAVEKFLPAVTSSASASLSKVRSAY